MSERGRAFKTRFLAICFVLGAGTVGTLAAVLSAQTAPKPALPSIPDLSGIWDNTHQDVNRGGAAAGPPGGFMGPGGIPTFGFTTEEPSMLPAAAEQYKAARTGVARGPLDRGRDDLDPTHYCYPYGPTRMYTTPRPWEIRQLPDVVLLIFEGDHWVRRVYLDGRNHPDGYPLTWMGHSIGKYEGDSLVIDTVGMREGTWLDHMGHPHSDALHLTERLRRLDHDTLQVDLTFDDPKTYTKPWTGKKIFKLAPATFEILEDVICEDWLEMKKQP
jgi:hypothetical protein